MDGSYVHLPVDTIGLLISISEDPVNISVCCGGILTGLTLRKLTDISSITGAEGRKTIPAIQHITDLEVVRSGFLQDCVAA